MVCKIPKERIHASGDRSQKTGVRMMGLEWRSSGS
jgi:hypothetical protein